MLVVSLVFFTWRLSEHSALITVLLYDCSLCTIWIYFNININIAVFTFCCRGELNVPYALITCVKLQVFKKY